MAKANPVTDQNRETVRQLHAEGLGRNAIAIAKQLKCSGRTISEIAGELGISFAARAGQVAAATEVRQADLADRRTAFATKLQDIAEREAAKISQPLLYWDWGGKEHDFDTHLAPEPIPADKRDLMGTVATALDRSLKLVPPKEESGIEEGLALITQLMSGLTAVYKAEQQDQEADEGAWCLMRAVHSTLLAIRPAGAGGRTGTSATSAPYHDLRRGRRRDCRRTPWSSPVFGRRCAARWSSMARSARRPTSPAPPGGPNRQREPAVSARRARSRLRPDNCAPTCGACATSSVGSPRSSR
ncbi:hypothetical protein ACH489_21540 [Streptomyces rubiginosohelvolus]|uniref:hypothetical protein n=1 Tax=Streptomyces rubiginosohelvolus TaxID=67362 RepID=UPI00379D8CFD